MEEYPIFGWKQTVMTLVVLNGLFGDLVVLGC